jgi:CRP-like cAMP-binding protein
MGAPLDLLRSVPLFSRVDDKHLKRLGESFTARQFTAGQELVTEGSGGVGFFIIEAGQARVSVDGEFRVELGPGDHFGEIALIDGGLRTATVTAVTDGTMHGMTSWQFRPLVEDNASIAWPLLEAMAKRTRDLELRAGS